MTSKEQRKYKNLAIGAVAGIVVASLFPSVLRVVDNFKAQVGL